MLQGRAVSGFEQVIENLAALRFGVVDQQARRGAGTGGSKSVENSALARPIQNHGRLLVVVRCQRRNGWPP